MYRCHSYERQETDETGTYHNGVGAVVYAIEHGLEKQQLNCTFSDDDGDLKMCRGNEGDTILSDITTIRSTSKRAIHLEVCYYTLYSKICLFLVIYRYVSLKKIHITFSSK